MAVAILFTSGYGVVNYLTMVFFPVYAGQFGGLSEARALQATTVAQALALVIVPLAGLANDAFIRRRTLLMIAFAAEFAVALAGFLLARDGGFAGFALAQVAFGAADEEQCQVESAERILGGNLDGLPEVVLGLA